jgi:hypothetical protein
VTEVWTTGQVAAHCGIEPQSVSNRMSRLGVPVYDREPGRGGRNRYDADLVKAAVARATGKGHGTPRKLTDEQVAAIRAAQGQRPAKELAVEYGVSAVYVRALWAGRNRKPAAPHPSGDAS